MARRKVTEVTEFGPEDPQEQQPDMAVPAAAPRNGRSEEVVDPTEQERRDAAAARYRYIQARYDADLRRLQKQIDEAKSKPEASEDEIDKVQAQLIKTMKAQVTMKQLQKMLGDDEPRRGGDTEHLRGEFREAMQYLERKMESVSQGRGDQQMFHMMMQQQAQQQAQQMQMMMAMLTRQDPNAAMQQQILLKLMDSKATIKDFLPMITEAQKMTSASMAGVEEARMGMMQEVLAHMLSAGEKDWGSMSLPEKMEFVMSMMKRGSSMVVEKFRDIKGAVRSYKKPEHKLSDKPAQKLGLAGPDVPVAAPPAGPVEPAAVDAPLQANPQQTTIPTDEDIRAMIADRVGRILTVVETELKIGSDPYVVFEEIEPLYFGLPEEIREKIEAQADPMEMVNAIEPFADKQQLERITQMAIADAKKAQWLKAFVEAAAGIDDEEEEEEDEEDDGEEEGGSPQDKEQPGV